MQWLKRLDKRGRLRSFIRTNSFFNKLHREYYSEIMIARTRRRVGVYGIETLELILDLLNSETAAFADFGTLLGLIREGCLLEGDLDIDIGVLLENEYSITKMQRLLQSASFRLITAYLFKGDIVGQKYRYRKIKFDISFYKSDGKQSYCYVCYARKDDGIGPDQRRVIKFTHNLIKQLEERRFDDIVVKVPFNPESFLKEKYGPSWMIPDTNYIHWQNPVAEHCEGIASVINY